MAPEAAVSPRVGTGRSWKAAAHALAWPQNYTRVDKMRAMFELTDADSDGAIKHDDVRLLIRAARDNREPSKDEVGAVVDEMIALGAPEAHPETPRAALSPARRALHGSGMAGAGQSVVITQQVFSRWVERTARCKNAIID